MAISSSKKRLQVSLRKEVTEKLDKLSHEGYSKSYIIERALVDYLDKIGYFKEEERVLFL